MAENNKKILELKHVTTRFRFGGKELIAVNDVSMVVYEKEIVGLVGESGCGKSMTAFSILGIVPLPGEIIRGEIYFKGKNILKLGYKEMRKIRGGGISLIYQDPLSSLNPSFNIYWHLNEILKAHKPGLKRREKFELVINSLKKVGIVNPEEKIFQYPHQFSGGMRQRVVIAMSLLLNPSLIIADEPTTSLDVTTQKEIFNLIEKLKEELSISFIVISHDLYLIGERCDRIYVMYSGEIVESGYSHDIFDKPLHPYTAGLFESIPKLDLVSEELGTIKGEVQNLMDLADECFFSSRCKYADAICRSKRPVLENVNGYRMVRCWKARNLNLTREV
jgi:peptide/nickel transport system ATP-binding protein/oligopeptide transport system ATP-binding protein